MLIATMPAYHRPTSTRQVIGNIADLNATDNLQGGGRLGRRLEIERGWC